MLFNVLFFALSVLALPPKNNVGRYQKNILTTPNPTLTAEGKSSLNLKEAKMKAEIDAILKTLPRVCPTLFMDAAANLRNDLFEFHARDIQTVYVIIKLDSN